MPVWLSAQPNIDDQGRICVNKSWSVPYCSIKMDGNVIVDGNHRYIAAKILGRNPEVTSGILPPNKAGQTKPVSELKVDEVDWGNK